MGNNTQLNMNRFVFAIFVVSGAYISGKWGNVKRNFSSVSQGVYIANMVIFMY